MEHGGVFFPRSKGADSAQTRAWKEFCSAGLALVPQWCVRGQSHVSCSCDVEQPPVMFFHMKQKDPGLNLFATFSSEHLHLLKPCPSCSRTECASPTQNSREFLSFPTANPMSGHGMSNQLLSNALLPDKAAVSPLADGGPEPQRK